MESAKSKWEPKLKIRLSTIFSNSLKAGSLKPHYKSSGTPADPKENEVTILTGDNWDSIVMSPKKDVMVEYYAPYCEAPAWTENLLTPSYFGGCNCTVKTPL